MRVTFNISQDYVDPFISINAPSETEDLIQLGRTIDRIASNTRINGVSNGKTVPLSLYQIIRFYTDNRDVMCETVNGSFRVKYRIYELVKLLKKDDFIQISSSEIINLNFLSNLSATASGLYQVNFSNGQQSYISRRFMKQLRKELLK